MPINHQRQWKNGHLNLSNNHPEHQATQNKVRIFCEGEKWQQRTLVSGVQDTTFGAWQMQIRTSALISSRSKQLGSKSTAVAPILRWPMITKAPPALFEKWQLSASITWCKFGDWNERTKEEKCTEGRREHYQAGVLFCVKSDRITENKV